MYTVKTFGTIRYVLYYFQNVEWAWVRGLYFVHHDFEEVFLRRLRSHDLV